LKGKLKEIVGKLCLNSKLHVEGKDNNQRGESHVVDNCRGTGNFVLLGLVTGYTMGYFIHILLAIAIVVVLIGVIQGRRG